MVFLSITMSDIPKMYCDPSKYSGLIVITSLTGVKLYGVTNNLKNMTYRQVLDKMYSELKYEASNMDKKNMFFEDPQTGEIEYEMDKKIPMPKGANQIELNLKYMSCESNATKK